MSPQEQLALIQLVKNIRHSYALEQYTDAALKPLLKAVEQAQQEILTLIANKGAELTDWQEERAIALLDEWSDMQVGIRNYLGESIGEIAAHAGAASYTIHNDILSFGGQVNGFNNVALTASQIQSLLVDTPIGGKLLSEWVGSAFEFQEGIIQQEIITGMLRGQGYPGLVRRLREGMEMAREDAITITRSYVQAVNVNAAHDVASANKDIFKGWKWSSAAENGAYYTSSGKGRGRGICPICACLDAADEIYPMDGGPEIPAHPNCLVGETPVFAPDKRAAFVTSYSGPIIEFGVTGTRRLSVTPNHMFLTPQGWIAAKFLRQGDQIFDSTIGKRIVDGAPNNNDSPTLIKNIVRAFSESPGVATKSVPLSPEYLHGDGRFCDSDIDIIAPDSFLRNDIEPSFLEALGQIKFDGEYPGISFPVLRDFLAQLFALRDAADGFMGFRRVAPVFLRRAGFHHKAVGSGLISDGYPGLNQSFADGGPRNLERFGNGVFRFPGQIPFYNIPGWQGLPHTITLNPMSPHYNGQSSSGNATEFEDIFKRFPGQVQLASVEFVSERYFSGQVYDLQTFSSLYTANGLVSSNCRCVRKYVTKSWRELGIPIDEIEKATRPYSVRGKGIDPQTGEIVPQSVGTGGRNILSAGQLVGSYEDFFKTVLTPIEQKMTIGPNRLELWQAGKVKLGDLVVVEDGKARLLTLKELGDK